MTAKKTIRLRVNALALDAAESLDSLHQAAEILRRGGTVAFPTETVYGLGANALDAAAVQGIFEAKQRPAWDPLIVHIASEEQLPLVAVDIPKNGRLLMEAFWPGPLTLLLPKSAGVPPIVTAGRKRVGVRKPRHAVAQRLIELAQVPVAAPSANTFGRTSPTRAEFVLQDLEGRIDAILDAGDTTLGLESTVVDACATPPVLYRPGMVTLQQLQRVCPSLMVYREPSETTTEPQALPSPGVGLKHYSPRARLVLLEGEAASVEQLRVLAGQLQTGGELVGVMMDTVTDTDTQPGANFGFATDTVLCRWGDKRDQAELARRLFAGLRELDAAGVTVILCPLPLDEGLGVAMRDRLFKAAR